MIGHTLDNRYHLTERIGTGGMGTVYKGSDTLTGDLVAIKHLKPEAIASDPDLIRRFEREGEALRQLNHPNIVKVLATVREINDHFLIMEYMDGGDLAQVIHQETQLPIQQILTIAIELADALTRAHYLGIIHRDLKPANILIAHDGTPRLTDFGVAHFVHKDRVTDTGVAIGTLDYMSPEILNGDEPDPRADIWSFGVMLFEMLVRVRPFAAQTTPGLLTAILTQPVPDLETLRPDVPVVLVDLIYRMLEKDRNQRIRSIRLVGAELEAIMQGDVPIQQSQPTRFLTPTPDWHTSKNNLPAQNTPFVGRDAELVELARLIDDPNIRLLTILAPGGMGKTRLALELAGKYANTQTSFPNGVYFVELAPLSDPANIVPAIADATGYQFQGDGREPRRQILDFLANKHLLLVIDNFEHLLDGAGLVTEILQAAPGLKILATSRIRLSQPGETLFHLSGMDFPDWETPEDALDYAAVNLFMSSAARAQPGFELRTDNLDAVARICRLVEGMPLAIVLAAAWLALLTPEEVAAEIGESIDFLASEGGEVPERQRSIRAVFDHSWEMMNDTERAVFMQLSVFRGGFTRDAAEVIVDADLRTLMNLTNKALLRRDVNSGRYEIHELLRQYAEEQLQIAGNAYNVRDVHCFYYMTFLAEREADIKGGRQLAALNEIEADFGNIRVAWQWAVQRRQVDAIDGALECVYWFCVFRSRFQEGVELLRWNIEQLAIEAEWVWSRILVRQRVMMTLGYMADGIIETQLEKAREIIKNRKGGR